MNMPAEIPPELQYFTDDKGLSWCEHWVYRLDGSGGRIGQPATFRFLPSHHNQMVFPWSMAKMDNGEVAVAAVACEMTKLQSPSGVPNVPKQTVLAFSSDQGATWSDYVEVEGCESRPMMLIYLGNGELSFMTSFEASGNCRYYSKDFGRTWTERVTLDLAPDGLPVSSEGNSLVEYDDNGIAIALAETGQTMRKGPDGHYECRGCVRWSHDGGRSWDRFQWPKVWQWQDTHDGQTYERGVGEGALVRAANGWIVAAMRTDMPARFMPLRHDNFEGVAVSISKDDGETWSPLKVVLDLGRHHMNLMRLPNDDLVMAVIRRLDFSNDRLASYRRGCDAVVSHDNGLTWDVEHMYVLDEFSAICTPRELPTHWKGYKWFSTICGHLGSVALDDGSVLTIYGNYRNAGALIRWRPDA